ncbi:hypothetical protein Vadar_013264 [Vaccinium darrowii]|nr:hypothetical protein Vadar_013264 [Vaccinium darrowii]
MKSRGGATNEGVIANAVRSGPHMEQKAGFSFGQSGDSSRANALIAPLWNINAHSIIYILRESGRLQIVGNSGNSAFDDHVREGQLIVVPQNFAVIKKASDQGLEWISFKTNGNAMTSRLAGRVSVIRNIPEEVLMNSYDILREEARSLKYSRDEVTVFGPGSRSQSESEA